MHKVLPRWLENNTWFWKRRTLVHFQPIADFLAVNTFQKQTSFWKNTAKLLSIGDKNKPHSHFDHSLLSFRAVRKHMSRNLRDVSTHSFHSWLNMTNEMFRQRSLRSLAQHDRYSHSALDDRDVSTRRRCHSEPAVRLCRRISARLNMTKKTEPVKLCFLILRSFHLVIKPRFSINSPCEFLKWR